MDAYDMEGLESAARKGCQLCTDHDIDEAAVVRGGRKAAGTGYLPCNLSRGKVPARRV